MIFLDTAKQEIEHAISNELHERARHLVHVIEESTWSETGRTARDELHKMMEAGGIFASAARPNLMAMATEKTRDEDEVDIYS